VKFLADECCDTELVTLLRSEGHDVLYVMEFKPGALDKKVLEKAFAEKRILLTEDKDFGELVYRLKKPAYSIVLLRFDERELEIGILLLRQCSTLPFRLTFNR
jgi:predicted nuclease of predicted toxin-antitoxin system